MSQLEQQMVHRDREMVPRVLVRLMFGLMAVTLLLVAAFQYTGGEKRGVVEASPVVQERLVHFNAVERSGTYVITDTSGTQIARSDEGLNGFLSVMGRAMDRQRLRAGADATAAYAVVEKENGHIALRDPETGFEVEMIGYGADNIAAIANLLN